MRKTSKNFRKIDETLSEFLRPIFNGGKKEFLIINNLAKNWQQIIGSRYFATCKPKLVQLQLQNESKNVDIASSPAYSGGKLTIIAFDSATGFFLKNSAETIIERISVLYGFKTISKILVKQEPKMLIQDANSQKIAAIANISSNSKNRIDQRVSKVNNQELSKILSELGSLIFTKNLN